MQKIAVVTGAAGFLGVHLSNRLLDENCIVIGIDNFSTSNKDSQQFKLLKNRKYFYFQEFDIQDGARWQRLQFYVDDIHDVLEHKGKFVDYVFNFACPASPIQYMRMPIQTLMTSVNGTYNALEFARKTNCVFLQASTSEVYGDALVSPQPETYYGNVNSYGPRSQYDEGKRCSEVLLYEYRNLHNLDARIVRIFNTYGPGMLAQDGRVISTFISQALSNQALTIFGDGNQTRSFCYVDDLIESIYRVSQLPKDVLTSPVNIGNDHEFTLMELVKIISRALCKELNILYKPLPGDDPKQRRPDLTKARKLLNYEAKVSLEEGVQRTIDWFNKII